MKVLILSAKENVFQMFNYMIQNGFDPYFEKNPIFKNDNQLIMNFNFISIFFYSKEQLYNRKQNKNWKH